MIQRVDRTEMDDGEHKAPDRELGDVSGKSVEHLDQHDVFGPEARGERDARVARRQGPGEDFLDPGRLPAETCNLIDRIRKRYGIAIEDCLPQTQAWRLWSASRA
jgi:hypothetical protein